MNLRKFQVTNSIYMQESFTIITINSSIILNKLFVLLLLVSNSPVYDLDRGFETKTIRLVNDVRARERVGAVTHVVLVQVSQVDDFNLGVGVSQDTLNIAVVSLLLGGFNLRVLMTPPGQQDITSSGSN